MDNWYAGIEMRKIVKHKSIMEELRHWIKSYPWTSSYPG